MNDKSWVFRRASDLGISMQEMGRRGAAARNKRRAKPTPTYPRCRKCGGIVSLNQCLNCGF